MPQLGFYWKDFYATKYVAIIGVVGTFISTLLLISLLIRAMYDFLYRTKHIKQFQTNNTGLTKSSNKRYRNTKKTTKNHSKKLPRLHQSPIASNSSNQTHNITNVNAGTNYNNDSTSGSEIEIIEEKNSDNTNSTQNFNIHTITTIPEVPSTRSIRKMKQKLSEIKQISKIAGSSKALLFSSLTWSILYSLLAFIIIFLHLFFYIRIFSCGDRASLAILYGFQRMSLMLFFVSRLHNTFKDTIFRIKKLFIINFVIITVLFYNSAPIWYVYTAYTTMNGYDCNTKALVLPTMSSALIDGMWNLFLSIYFQIKLKEVHRDLNPISNATKNEKMIASSIAKDRTSDVSTTATPTPTTGATLKRMRSGLSRTQVEKMHRLVKKLFILLVSNISISLLCLAVLYIFVDAGFLAACIDMLVSNLCLWLSYSFNIKLYKKICKPCIACSYAIQCV